MAWTFEPMCQNPAVFTTIIATQCWTLSWIFVTLASKLSILKIILNFIEPLRQDVALCTRQTNSSFRDNILRSSSASAIDEFQNKMRENGQALETVNFPLRLYSDSDYAPPYIQFDDQHKGFIFHTDTPLSAKCCLERHLTAGMKTHFGTKPRGSPVSLRLHACIFRTVKVVYHTKNWRGLSSVCSAMKMSSYENKGNQSNSQVCQRV